MIRFYRQLSMFIIVILVLSAMTMLIAVETDDETGDSEDVVSPGGNPITSEAAIVIDFDTGLVIFEHNADEQRVPASMAKMVAVYVVLDAIRDGYVSLDTIIYISDSASDFSYVRAYSNVPMPKESSYTIRRLLDVVIVRSASASTIALGEGIFGSEEALVAKMNEKAQQLGIEAVFYDSWGGSPRNRISARGMAELTRSMIKEYPEVLAVTSKRSVFFDGIFYRSTNPLISDYEGVDGFKTGFTNPAGWCFTGTAIQGGRRIISVTMGSVQGYRFTDSVILLDHGFSNYSSVIAGHFRSSLQSSDIALVPIMMFNIEEAKYLDLRDLAIMLNENN